MIKQKKILLLKVGLKELIESYPNSFNTFIKSELKQLAIKEEDIDYKNCLKKFFLMVSIF